MRCPFCGHIDSQVKDSRPTEDGSAIRRRRFCPSCGGRFTTFERVQLRELTVLKKNGKRAPFERDKLYRSIQISLRKRPVDLARQKHKRKYENIQFQTTETAVSPKKFRRRRYAPAGRSVAYIRRLHGPDTPRL